MDPNQPSMQRRRSERVSESVPLIVRGIDLLGQPFEERTSTLALNLHGCRYSSKHHLPRNTWVTLEVPRSGETRGVRARVAWIQRPHSVREFFQIGVELEGPANIWGLEAAPESWQQATRFPDQQGLRAQKEEFPMSDITNPAGGFESARSPSTPESAPETESPLLRDWRAEIERQANQAAERAAAEASERMRGAIRELEGFSSGLSAKQEEFLGSLRTEFEGSLAEGRELLEELDTKAAALRGESEAAAESASRMAQARLQIEAAEAALAAKLANGVEQPEAASGAATVNWRHQLQSEMTAAQAQWNELLQVSLDDTVERLAQKLAGRSEEAVRGTEDAISRRFLELSEPLGQVTTDARRTLSDLRAALDEQIVQARSSLSEIEQSAGRLREYSSQLESASHDTLNELHRRLENILEAQTDEMRQRVEQLANDAQGRLGPALDAMGQQVAERTIADVQSKAAPHIERVPELLRELSARELQAEGSLRLFRERLRQAAENNHREASEQLASALAAVRNDFESARREALARWNEELDASGVRASHVAAESIGRSSEWFQQEARARMQVLVEQTLATAATTFDEKTSEAGREFAAKLDEQSAGRIAQLHQDLQGVTNELSGRVRTDIAAAAESAAASFGQVLRGISEHEAAQFTNATEAILRERQQEFDQLAAGALEGLKASASASIDGFRGQITSQMEASVAEGREALGSEFSSMIDAFRGEREEYKNDWATGLDQLSVEATAKHQERLQATSDSWVASSMRRLNEHGQSTIESLIRTADKSLRDSCSKVFEDLAEMLRRTSSMSEAVGFAAPIGYNSGESPAQHQQTASGI